MEITEEVFDEIKKLQKEGHNSKEVSHIFSDKGIVLSFVQVNDIFSYESFKIFDENRGKVEKVLPAQSAYYRSLIARKHEENSNLKEQRGWLLEQVYFLRKAVKFLEARKGELELGIKQMESVLRVGVEGVEILEQNENFDV